MSVRRFALLGHPIAHTMSPFIHEKLFELSGKPGKYSMLDTPPERLPRIAKNVLNAFAGYNVTIPYKRKIIPLLQELDQKAERYGSVNTVHCKGGKAIGYTTDPDGLLTALKMAGMPLEGRVAVLGSGGAARVMAYEAALAGCEVVIAVREKRLEKAGELAKEISSSCGAENISTCLLSDIDGDIDLLMNATPVGMYPNTEGMPVDRGVLTRTKRLFDAVYNPGETVLMRAAAAEGSQVLGGMSMLVWQAAAAHEIWDGVTFGKAAMEALCEEAIAEMNRKFAEE